MRNILFSFILNDTGVTAIEYALIASLIALVIIGSVKLVGQKVMNDFNQIENGIP
jgi:pilus assembly protein Flp/PilA